MPIVEVEIVLLPGESMRSGLAAEIADRCGEVFGSPPGSTWVKLRAIPCDHYAEAAAAHPMASIPSSCRCSRPGCPPRTRSALRWPGSARPSPKPPSGRWKTSTSPICPQARCVAFGGELVSAE